MAEAELKNAADRIPRMLRIRLEASYEQSDAKIDPDELTERVVSAVRERIDKMVLNTQLLARDEHIIEPGASKNDLDNLLELFNKEE